MRATNSMAGITTSMGVMEALPGCGNCVGSGGAPKLFAQGYERPVTAWLRDTDHLSREMRAVGLDGKERTISLLAFADDVLRKLEGMGAMELREFVECG